MIAGIIIIPAFVYLMAIFKGKKMIIFYDSDCLLCDTFVQFVAKRDQKHQFQFTSANVLQAEIQEDLSYLKSLNANTIICLTHGKFYTKSQAIQKIFNALGGWYLCLALFLFLVPRNLLDFLYDKVARHRKSIFKNKELCSLQSGNIVQQRMLQHTAPIRGELLAPKPIFLTGEWRHLVMLNYEVEPHILKKYVPIGTELDFFAGKCYVSLVAFLFIKTKVMGMTVPFHTRFPEINLRFYVRRKRGHSWERGVVFIKEFVPKQAIVTVANGIYQENYAYAQMRTQITPQKYDYIWKTNKSDPQNCILVQTQGDSKPLPKDTLSEFITEHYYGYVKQKNGSTKEYEVRHPRWKVWEQASANIQVDFTKLYGKEFAFLSETQPACIFVADGSAISVHWATEIYF